MTDEEIIALVDSKLPQELSVEELDLIRERMRQSAVVRQVLGEQLERDPHLAAVIGQVDGLPEPAQADAASGPQRGRVWMRLGLTAGGLLTALIASLLVWSPVFGPADKVSANLPRGNDSKDQPIASQALASTRTSAGARSDGVGKPDAASGPASATNPKSPQPGDRQKAAPAQPAKKTPVAPAVEIVESPWLAADQLGRPPRPSAEIAFDPFDAFYLPSAVPPLRECQRWLKPVNGTKFEWRGWWSRQMAYFEGIVQFRAPWSEDNIFRLSLVECPGLAIHFWKGSTGVSLMLHQRHWDLSAYETQREGNKPQPRRYRLVATDERRNSATTKDYPLRLDIRFHGGELIVSRGDIVLLRAPFDGLPTETFLDGHGMIAGLAMVRASDVLPAEPDPLPVAVDITQPATLAWHGENVSGATFSRSPDGPVELEAEKNPKPALEWFDLPKQGLYEVLIELDGVTPGTRLVFGPAGADSQTTLGFFQETRIGGMSCRPTNINDPPGNYDLEFTYDPAPLASPHQWIKLVAGCRMVKCYLGVDGIHWARFWPAEYGAWSVPIGRIGLWCAAGDGRRTIGLRRVVLREFHELNQLAPADLLAKAPTIKAGDLPGWLSEVAKAMPAGVDVAAWQRACALKTLAANADVPVGADLVLGLLDDALARPMPLDQRLRLFHEAALLINVFDDANRADQFAARYQVLGQQLLREGELAPWSRLVPELMRSPLWCGGQNDTILASMGRRELVQAAFGGQVDQAAKTLERLRLLNLAIGDPLVQWGEDWVTAHRGDVALGDAVIGRKAWRHPYIDELSNEGFGVLADFEAALDSQSYHDAGEILAGAPAANAIGLMPDTRDAQLLTSLDAAIDGALARYPELREAMVRQFGPVGMLRLRQAMNDGDADAVADVTLHYRGTDAAGEAFLWLGDRACSGGDFAGARLDYRQALRSGGPTLAEQVAPRDRLAAAMLGEDVGKPPTTIVRLGSAEIAPADFESLVAEMRKAHAKVGSGNAAALAVKWSAPAPSDFDVRELARLDGDMGDNPGDVGSASPARTNTVHWLTRTIDQESFATAADPVEVTRGLDWASRQIAVAVDGEQVYLSNRFQVSAYDLKTGQRAWRTELGGEHGRTHEWTLTPMRPLPVGDRVFVRRLMHNGPELAALEKPGGKVAWRAPTDLNVVSDPLWDGERLLAVTATHGDQQWSFYLTEFDPRTGARKSQQRVATLRDWWTDERACQLSQVGENVVIVLAGTVICTDPTGKTRWVRRQEWLSAAANRDWGRQYQDPPLVAGDRLLVTQPGVAAVECLDIESGQLHWRKALAGIHRLNGFIGDRLIVETDDGLLAISIAKGDVLWQHAAGDLLEVQLCGGPGQLVYACRQRSPDKPGELRPLLVWLDPATGQEVAHTPLANLSNALPMFGPMFSVGPRTLALAANGENEPTRRIVELTPHGSPISTAIGAIH